MARRTEWKDARRQAYDDLYSIVPEYMSLASKELKWQYGMKKEILEFFDKHVGRENAVPLNKIAASLGLPATGNSVLFRNLVASLVEEDLVPIVACPRGYYKANKNEHFAESIEMEEARIKGIQRRIKALRAIQYRQNNDKQRWLRDW